jgi:hypothetical protein
MTLTKPAKYLLEWFVRYTKNRDLVFRKIKDIKEQDNKAIVEQKDGRKITYYIEPFPADIEKLAAGMKEKETGIVMYNTPGNFDKAYKAWKKLAAVQGLTLYFVNPFSKIEKRWIVNPYIHGKISEAEALKEGLHSMYVLVEPISEAEIAELTK